MVTSETWGRRSLFSVDRWAELFIKTLFQYRGDAYLLHEFVLMPDHFHLLITPQITLERALQFVKGGFSFRAKRELGSGMEVWEKGFQDHRIRDIEDYLIHVRYIHENPVRKNLCESPNAYAWSSARARYEVDEVPQGLKPQDNGSAGIRAPKGASLQNNLDDSTVAPKGATLQDKEEQDDLTGAAKAAPFQR